MPERAAPRLRLAARVPERSLPALDSSLPLADELRQAVAQL